MEAQSKYKTACIICIILTIIDFFVPDPIPFVDEIVLPILSFYLAHKASSVPEEAELGQKVMQVNNSVKQRKTSRIAARTDVTRQHTTKSDDFKSMGGF